MAGRAVPLGRTAPGLAAAALLLAVCGGTLAAVVARAGGFGGLGAADVAALRFTLWQAFLSAAFSTLLAVPVARALARRHFAGRRLLIGLLGAPFILPVIVAMIGLIAIFGQNGLISDALALIGLPPIPIYGLHGVVLAHVFFNLPLATRLILHGWMAIPVEHFRLAESLSMRPRDLFLRLEVPMLTRILPGAAALIFLICTTSFAVALTLGGGPRATTIELAIYQAFRFEFDLGHAATLALVQFAIGLAAALLAFRLRGAVVATAGLGRPLSVPRPPSALSRIADGALIGLAALFLFLPVGAVVAAGIGGLAHVPASIWPAILRTLMVAAAATALTLGLALPMAQAAVSLRRGAAAWVEATGFLVLSVSPLVIGTGLFLLTFPYTDPVDLALPVTALVNAMLALPFALQALATALAQAEADFGRLADGLGLTGLARWRRLLLPRLRRPLGFAAGLTAALSIGDLGVIALFADPAAPTLPLYVFQLMGAYQTEAAAGAALALLALSLGVFWIIDRGGRVNAET